MRLRTGYSFRTAFGHLPDIIEVLKKNGETVAPISDRMSTFGYNRWSKLCSKNELRPVFGVELGVVPYLGEKKPTVDFWTFWAIDEIVDLHAAIGLATSNPGRDPSLTYAQALSFKNLVKIGGERIQIGELNAAVNDDNFYLSLSPSTPIGLVKAGLKAGHKFIAQSDNYYPLPEDKEVYRVALGSKRANTQTYPMHIMSEVEWQGFMRQSFSWRLLESAWGNKNFVMDQCRAVPKKATLLKPQHDLDLEQLCILGAKAKGIDLADPVYTNRMRRELDLIKEKDFEDYFYIIADMVSWAKQRMIVGPARGSSCGSLVCFLLDITTVDPIPFKLIFERFIDVNRTDLPDIDIDFSDKLRHKVFEYAEDKYGKDHVARLGTVGMFKPRSAMKQAAASLRIPGWRIEKVTDNLIERKSGDARAEQVLEDTLKETESGRDILKEYPEIFIAAEMEGHPNNASQHAAGVVITESPVSDFVAVDNRTHSVMCDKKDAEDYNLLKIDALGLTQLSIFERTLELIGEKPVSGWLEKLPLDDEGAFNILNQKKFSGVFQFAGGALQSLVKQIKVTKIDDIISITALARPGPMASGGANSWVKRRAGLEKVSYIHELFKPQLEETLGIVVYQEQVMNIAREIGGLSWGDVTELRKAMSRSLGKEYFDKYGDRWKVEAHRKGIPMNILEKAWDDLCSFGSWAFNKSHSVAYGIVSYWCCWLKAHHPLEFAAATLDAESDPMRQIQLLREMMHEDIDYVSVDPQYSIDRWTVTERAGKKILVGPLTQIKGIGPATLSEILLARKEGRELRPVIRKRLTSAKTGIDSLFPIADRIKKIVPDLGKLHILSEVNDIRSIQCGVKGEVLIIGVAKSIALKDESEFMAKRGYTEGPTKALNLFFLDDTDEIFCKIDRFDFDRLGEAVIERGRPGNAIYAVKGTVPDSFRMISVKNIRYIGDMDDTGGVS